MKIFGKREQWVKDIIGDADHRSLEFDLKYVKLCNTWFKVVEMSDEEMEPVLKEREIRRLKNLLKEKTSELHFITWKLSELEEIENEKTKNN